VLEILVSSFWQTVLCRLFVQVLCDRQKRPGCYSQKLHSKSPDDASSSHNGNWTSDCSRHGEHC